MGRSKSKHDRRRAHQREQRAKKNEALTESIEAALSMSADGKKILSRPRTGKAYDEALVREMLKRGYERKRDGSWRRVPAEVA
jgi:CO/xanthine dehydrogenase FAD-binding subunit